MTLAHNVVEPSILRPEFSVVIPTYGRPDALAACLEQLVPGAQTFSGAYEVIVTDDAPAPGASAKLANRFPAVRWTEGPHRGPAANRNHGAR
jgi:GT2 family glycosyltransferase